jgi:hypothetical protein
VANDHGEDLLPLVEAAEKTTGKVFQTVSADSAFYDYETLSAIENRSEDFHIPDKKFEVTEKNETTKGEYDA